MSDGKKIIMVAIVIGVAWYLTRQKNPVSGNSRVVINDPVIVTDPVGRSRSDAVIDYFLHGSAGRG